MAFPAVAALTPIIVDAAGAILESATSPPTPPPPASPVAAAPAASEEPGGSLEGDDPDEIMKRLTRMAKAEREHNQSMLESHLAAGALVISGRAALTLQELAKRSFFT